jgi:hypothetical protein
MLDVLTLDVKKQQFLSILKQISFIFFAGNVTIMGWGSTGTRWNDLYEMPTTPKMSSLSIISNKECSRYPNVTSYGQLNSTTMCAVSNEVTVCGGSYIFLMRTTKLPNS